MNLDRREFFRKGYSVLGVGLGGSALTGCYDEPGVDSTETIIPPSEKAVVTRLRVRSVARASRVVGVLSESLAEFPGLAMAGKSVLIASSVDAQRATTPRCWLLGLLADRFVSLGARVSFLGDSEEHLWSTEAGYVHHDGESVNGVRRLLATRYSGLNDVTVRRDSSTVDVIVSAAYSSADGPLILATSNLLNLLEGDPANSLLDGHVEEFLGDLAIDLASTFRPRLAVNVLVPTPATNHPALMVLGRELASVDAVACMERGLDPNATRVLRDLPSMLGPISPERIAIRDVLV